MNANLGDIDLHLFGEGRHEEIYKKLGAHVTKIGRKKGVAFVVWAPQAAGVIHIFKFDKDGNIALIQAVDGPGTKGTNWPYDK